jgi:hypothetical protein
VDELEFASLRIIYLQKKTVKVGGDSAVGKRKSMTRQTIDSKRLGTKDDFLN